MRKLSAVMLLLCSAGSMSALAASLTIGPVPAFYGPSTSDFGLGFTLTNASDFLVITAADLSGGSGVDLTDAFILDPFNFVVIGPAPYGVPSLSQIYDPVLRRGLGTVRVDTAQLSPVVPLLPLFTLTYDLYSVSPDDPAFNPDTDFLSGGNTVSATFSLLADDPQSPVPEPATGYLAGAAMCAFVYRKFSSRPKSVP